jgi:hypothetical protein
MADVAVLGTAFGAAISIAQQAFSGTSMSHYQTGNQQKLVNELLLRLKSRGFGDNDSIEEDKKRAKQIADEQLENRVLNARACSEYEYIKNRILACTEELNKYLDFDDLFKISAYQNCTSVRFRNRALIIEFKQVPFNDVQIHHSLDFIFQVSGANSGNTGRTTLVLGRQQDEFVWRQLAPVVHAPAASSKDLVASLMRWLEDGTDVFS